MILAQQYCKYTFGSETWILTWILIRNKLKEAAESIGLPTFIVSDAGRTQVIMLDIWLEI